MSGFRYVLLLEFEIEIIKKKIWFVVIDVVFIKLIEDDRKEI